MGWGSFINALKGIFQKFWIGVTVELPTGYIKPMDLAKRNTLTIDRLIFTDNSTIGELKMDGELFCYTLEDTCRAKGVKIPGRTAIPSGRYQLTIDESDRFQRLMPHLLNVPNFTGVRIHKGNTEKNTDGCILVGMRKGPDIVYDSKRAFDQLFPELQKRLEDGPLYVMIFGGPSQTT